MKTIFSTKKLFVAASMLLAFATEGFAQQEYNNVWVRADVYPAGSGKVFIDWNVDEVTYSETYSEFKRSINIAASNAFIYAKAKEGYLFAGVVRDINDNGQYDLDTDRQVHIWANHFFTAYYDHTPYISQISSGEAQEMAEDALALMKKPTDQLFAVFTQGAVAHRAVGEETWGKVYSSKVYNEVGDQVTFSAYGDSESTDDGTVYYKFDHWSNAAGQDVSTDRFLTVTVTGMETYYAHFVRTTKAEFKETETDPNKWDYDNKEWNPNAIQSVKNIPANSSVIYDLQGRRVSQPTKGVFIKDGKKVIVK